MLFFPFSHIILFSPFLCQHRRWQPVAATVLRPGEHATEGGEVAFVGRMIDESLELRFMCRYSAFSGPNREFFFEVGGPWVLGGWGSAHLHLPRCWPEWVLPPSWVFSIFGTKSQLFGPQYSLSEDLLGDLLPKFSQTEFVVDGCLPSWFSLLSGTGSGWCGTAPCWAANAAYPSCGVGLNRRRTYPEPPFIANF